MKKFLPIILLLVGVLVLGVILVLRNKTGGENEEAFLREIPLNERPVTSLTPREDGHWLKLVIDGLKIIGAKKLDYELLYKTEEGVTQGVPGSVEINGSKIERDLLLGSESSGKFRYDEGVEEGTLTLRFRNDRGKLIGKLTTDFHLQKETKDLSTVDGKFAFILNDKPKETFFVTMETFGLPKEISGVAQGPYGVFASKGGPFPGSLNLTTKVMRWDGVDWQAVTQNKSPDIGIFVGLRE